MRAMRPDGPCYAHHPAFLPTTPSKTPPTSTHPTQNPGSSSLLNPIHHHPYPLSIKATISPLVTTLTTTTTTMMMIQRRRRKNSDLHHHPNLSLPQHQQSYHQILRPRLGNSRDLHQSPESVDPIESSTTNHSAHTTTLVNPLTTNLIHLRDRSNHPPSQSSSHPSSHESRLLKLKQSHINKKKMDQDIKKNKRINDQENWRIGNLKTAHHQHSYQPHSDHPNKNTFGDRNNRFLRNDEIYSVRYLRRSHHHHHHHPERDGQVLFHVSNWNTEKNWNNGGGSHDEDEKDGQYHYSSNRLSLQLLKINSSSNPSIRKHPHQDHISRIDEILDKEEDEDSDHQLIFKMSPFSFPPTTTTTTTTINTASNTHTTTLDSTNSASSPIHLWNAQDHRSSSPLPSNASCRSYLQQNLERRLCGHDDDDEDEELFDGRSELDSSDHSDEDERSISITSVLPIDIPSHSHRSPSFII